MQNRRIDARRFAPELIQFDQVVVFVPPTSVTVQETLQYLTQFAPVKALG